MGKRRKPEPSPTPEPAAAENPRIAAAIATEVAAATGRAWAVKLLADGTVDRLRASQPIDQPGQYHTNDGPRWEGWTKCPCCCEPIYLVMSAKKGGKIWTHSPEEAPAAAQAAAPEYLQTYLAALSAGEPWAVEISTTRRTNEHQQPATHRPPDATAAPR